MTQAGTTARTLTIGSDLGDGFSRLRVLDVERARRWRREGCGRGADPSGEVRCDPGRADHDRRGQPLSVGVVAADGAGDDVLVASPGELRLIYKCDRKTDRFDAESLARVARMDPRLLSPVEPRSPQGGDLAILRARDCRVASLATLINHVRGAAKSLGGRLPRSPKPGPTRTSDPPPQIGFSCARSIP